MKRKVLAIPKKYTDENVSLLKEGVKEPCVILPFYGEYGFFVMSYIRMVHYLDCPYKVVCCRKGEECYFPSASEFFYDWSDPIPDKQKCGLRDEFGPVTKLRPEEIRLEATLTRKYPSFKLLRFEIHLSLGAVSFLPLDLKPLVTAGIKPDVVIGARKRTRDTQKNFKRWPIIIRALKKAGYSIGTIGLRKTSYDLAGVDVASWEYPRSADAGLEMLKKCKLYIGTDTGPTHLSALLGTPMIVFRNMNDYNFDLIYNCVESVVRAANGYVKVIHDGWEHPEKVIDAALKFLTKTGKCSPKI